jgi:hypothetical protein
MNVAQLAERTKAANEACLRLEGIHSQLSQQEDELRAEISELQHKQVVLKKSSEVLKKLLDDLLNQNLQALENLTTSGLKAVFNDQDLRFKTQVGEHGGKLSIELKTLDNNVEGGLESFGGSVSAIESFLLRLYVLRKMGLAPYVFLDESFAAVESTYVPNLGALCKTLAKKLGINIFLITHQDQFLEHADRAYKGTRVSLKNGSKMMKLVQVK